MPELMISPTPTPPQSSSGRSDALKQSDATGRPAEAAETDREGSMETPFAAVLKSRMAEQKASADAASTAGSVAKIAQAGAETASAGVDLSMLLPLLTSAANPTTNLDPSATSLDPVAKNPDEILSSDMQAAAEQAPLQTIPALATLAPSVMDTGPRKPNAEIPDDAPASASAKIGTSVQAAGKFEMDPAITAESGQKSHEKNAPETPAGDFHALMERAAALTPGATSAANGSSSNAGLRIDTPLGQPQWHEDVGQKLTWMVGNNRQQADLVLTPPQLGRIEVSLTMNGDQASAIFTSPNPVVREALENSLQRLREVLADAGVSLGQTQVGSESPNQSARREDRDSGMNNDTRHAMAVSLPALRAISESNVGRGMIDIFA